MLPQFLFALINSMYIIIYIIYIYLLCISFPFPLLLSPSPPPPSPASQLQCSEDGATVYDACLQRCICREGQLVECCRVRDDFASLSIDERRRYTQAILTVASDPSLRPRYEGLVALYRASFGTLAQNTNPNMSQFFAWNRYFLLQYEDLLQEVDCRITIPYWDWTALPMSPYLATVWSPESGFGDSSRSSDRCVENGPFRFDRFNVTPSAGGGCLTREYRMQMFPTRSNIEQDLLTLPADQFSRFHQFLQIFIHINIRCFVGGAMCSSNAANDPAYLLHLVQVDSIFSRWQSIDQDRFSAGLVDDNRPLDLATQYMVSNFSNNQNLPNGVRVCYNAPAFKSRRIPPGMQFLSSALLDMTNNAKLQMRCVPDDVMSRVTMTMQAANFMRSMCRD